MHLLDAWTSLDPGTLARRIGIPVAILLAALLPGRRSSRIAALAIALLVASLDELSAPWPVRVGWVIAWLGVAWQSGTPAHARENAHPRRRGALEAGALALPFGVALTLMLLAAVSRETLGAVDSRRASLGVLVAGTGLLHLMLRRHARRALVAFASLGLGLELLAASARAADVTHAGSPPGVALIATLFAVALTGRIASARERFAGSAFVPDAHELHD